MMTVEGGIEGRTVEGSQPSISVTLTAGSLLSLGLEVVRDKFPKKCSSAVLSSRLSCPMSVTGTVTVPARKKGQFRPYHSYVGRSWRLGGVYCLQMTLEIQLNLTPVPVAQTW